MRRHVRNLIRPSIVLALLIGLLLTPQNGTGCPFCSAIIPTFNEEIGNSDVALFARLVQAKPLAGNDSEDAARLVGSQATFSVDRVLKGQQLLGDQKTISMPFYGEPNQTDSYLVTASDPANLTWEVPQRLTARQREYVEKLVELPEMGPERLKFFQQYLRDADQMLKDDAYTEFARAPYSVVKQLKPDMDHQQLVEWIKDPETTASDRRLFLTMLGVCGDNDDLPMLEKRLRSTDPQAKTALDALIASYLTLRGEPGMELIEDLFLDQRVGNFSSDYADVYAAIMALRFHGAEGTVISKARVMQAFSHLLDNPQMADLVIPDLARWEDWSQVERLAELFRNTDPQTTWVRLPIVNYMRVCPRPEAAKALEEFRRLDPDSVERAMTFYPTLSVGEKDESVKDEGAKGSRGSGGSASDPSTKDE